MSNASRISYLAPLFALTLVAACDSDQDDLVEDGASADEGFRTGRTTRGSGSGILLNTNNFGEWPFTELKLDGSFHREVLLLDVEIAAFDHGGSRPAWELDDAPTGDTIEIDGGGIMQLEVNGAHMLTGTSVGGAFVQHGDFHDSIWRVQVDPAYVGDLDAAAVDHDGSGVVEMRLEVGWIFPDGTAPAVPGSGEDSDELHLSSVGAIPTYTFTYIKDGESTSTCSTSLVPGATYVESVLYNDVLIDEANGEVSFDDDLIQIACLEGAIGKAAGVWGYWPDDMDDPMTLAPGDTRDNFETITRVVRADYCADGSSWTVAGTELELYDSFAHTPAAAHVTDYGSTRPAVEAVWAPGGAVCVDFQRYVGAGSPSCGLPSCGGKWPAFGMLNDPSHPSVFLTRTTRVTELNI